MARSPMSHINRCTRFRLTGMPRRSSQAFIRLDPKKGVSRYRRAIRAASFLDLAFLDFCSLPLPKTPEGPLRKGLLPGLNLPGRDFLPGGQLGHRLPALQRLQTLPLRRQGATLALKAGLCFLRPCDTSCSFRQQPLPLSLGAGLSFPHLSKFRVRPNQIG